ncbi:hypothetical protein WOLCODRAFT_157691 [Wolfiporia cocos MD-104 SS10]|uniref:Uncharacterized protein n=1 Tax=Wolfiporia cocos (strain MD-104) TaxID=742152 RepID=A0A2H3JLV5_WOLCO|nr:hypothetical protein WOLCODRAFT_157691 [Wolfiporia cocos MD-104 SS10]
MTTRREQLSRVAPYNAEQSRYQGSSGNPSQPTAPRAREHTEEARDETDADYARGLYLSRVAAEWLQTMRALMRRLEGTAEHHFAERVTARRQCVQPATSNHVDEIISAEIVASEPDWLAEHFDQLPQDIVRERICITYDKYRRGLCLRPLIEDVDRMTR